MKIWLNIVLLILVLGCQNEYQEQVHWIGYIDPEAAFFTADFTPCSDTILLDYSSRSSRWEKRAGYYGGSKAIREILDKNYDSSKYKDSGYLTYRFVLNCIGETGRFVIDEASLNFENHSFDERLKQELLSITAGELTDWRPLCFKGENKDSYMFITYKIINGEITEILP